MLGQHERVGSSLGFRERIPSLPLGAPGGCWHSLALAMSLLSVPLWSFDIFLCVTFSQLQSSNAFVIAFENHQNILGSSSHVGVLSTIIHRLQPRSFVPVPGVRSQPSIGTVMFGWTWSVMSQKSSVGKDGYKACKSEKPQKVTTLREQAGNLGQSPGGCPLERGG